MGEETVSEEKELLETCMPDLPTTRQGIRTIIKTHIRRTERVAFRLGCLSLYARMRGNIDLSGQLAVVVDRLIEARNAMERILEVI